MSQHEVLSILSRIDFGKGGNFDIAFEDFWNNEIMTGSALTWEGAKRARDPNAKKSSERLNINLALRGIGVIDSSGRLTEEGLRLLQIGKVYEPSSVAFMRHLGRLLLKNGRLLELIIWTEKEQRKILEEYKSSALGFYRKLEERFRSLGILPATRKTQANKGGKLTYLRDEWKLMNKLGLLILSDNGQYFHPQEGLVFNWEAIISMIGFE